jgi:GNAT superfamily N-acetyltransferase
MSNPPFKLSTLEKDAFDHIEKLKKLGQLDSRIVLIPKSDAEGMKEAIRVATESFAGTTHSNPELTMDHLFGQYYRSKGDECGGFLKEEASEKRIGAYNSFITLISKLCSFVMAVKDEKTGEMIGVTFIEYNEKVAGTWQIVKAAYKVGFLKFIKLGLGFFRRMLPVADAVERLHHKVGCPHWYVVCLAASPKHQGKGVGSSLLAVTASLADRDGLQSYLETSGISNKDFYSRKGYEVLGTLESEKYGFNFEGGLYSMTRQPVGNSEALSEE